MTKRLLEDLENPLDPKNQYFAILQSLNRTKSKDFLELMKKIELRKRLGRPLVQVPEKVKDDNKVAKVSLKLPTSTMNKQ